MPWAPDDATRFTKKAKTPARKQLWADVANSTLQRTENEGLAVREANAALRDRHNEEKRKRRKR